MGTGYFASHPVIGYLSILVMALGAVLVLYVPCINRLFATHHRCFAGGFFLVSRVGLLLFIFVVIGYPGGPDKATWAHIGTSALKGLLPYVDFSCEYGPFYPYLLAPAFLVFSPMVAPVVVFIVFDFLAFLLLHYVSENREFNRRVATLYLITPLSWFVAVRYGQEESIGAFFGVLMLLLVRKKREDLVAVMGGLGVAFTKVLFLLPALPILLAYPRRFRACLIAGLIIAVCYLPFVILGGDVFEWAPRPGTFSGPCIWLGLLALGISNWQLANAVFIGLLALLVGIVLFRVHRMGVVNSVLLLYSGLMITSPKAWYCYSLLVLPFLCLRVMSSKQQRELVCFSIYSFLMVFYFYIVFGLRSDKFDLPYLLAVATIFLIVTYHTYLLVATVRTGWAREASRVE